MARYPFTKDDRDFLANTILIEIGANTSAQQRAVTVQMPDELAQQLDAVMVHDQNTNYIYTASLTPCDGVTTATSQAVGAIVVEEVGKAIAEATANATPDTTPTTSALLDDDDFGEWATDYTPRTLTTAPTPNAADVHLKHTVMPDRLPTYFATLTEMR